jgi:hypothetical protein
MSFLDGLLAAATGATGEYVRQNREQQDADRKALEREALFEQVKREKQWALQFDLDNAGKKAETTAMAEAGASQKVWNDPTQVAMRAGKAQEEIKRTLDGKRAELEFKKTPEYQDAIALEMKNGLSKLEAEEAIKSKFDIQRTKASQALGWAELGDRRKKEAQDKFDNTEAIKMKSRIAEISSIPTSERTLEEKKELKNLVDSAATKGKDFTAFLTPTARDAGFRIQTIDKQVKDDLSKPVTVKETVRINADGTYSPLTQAGTGKPPASARDDIAAKISKAKADHPGLSDLEASDFVATGKMPAPKQQQATAPKPVQAGLLAAAQPVAAKPAPVAPKPASVDPQVPQSPEERQRTIDSYKQALKNVDASIQANQQNPEKTMELIKQRADLVRIMQQKNLI